MAVYGFGGRRPGDPLTAFDELRREIDGLLGSWGRGFASGSGVGAPAVAAGVHPAVNLYEADGQLVLTAELPGVREEDLDVSIQANRVTLKGRRSIEHPEGASAHRRERQGGAFHRTVVLPYEVDAEKAEASYRHGVLMLRLPRPEEQQRRRIPVQSS
jgi:HSP20 family protein